MHSLTSRIKSSFYLALLFASSLSINLSAQDALPRVFMIGDHEKAYEKLVLDCNTMLLSVCQDNMQLAYSSWTKMIKDMEAYSDELNFDLKGVKIWLNVFWNADGTVRNIVYYPKPNSRNMNFEELTAFFTNFVKNYEFTYKTPMCYSHYGSASWPTFATLYRPQEK